MARKKKAEQTNLPGEGYARKVSPAIEKATAALIEARAGKDEAKEAEERAAAALVNAMAETGVDVHKFTDADGTEVTVRVKPGKVKVIVKRKKPAAAAEAEATN